MESRRNLRVLPSNAPTLVGSEDIQRSPSESLVIHTSLPTCPNFNNGIECKLCGLLHACSACSQLEHGSHACRKGILRVSSGNVGSNGLVPSPAESKTNLDGQCSFKASTASTKAPDRSAQAALKLHYRKGRRGLDPFSRLPLYHRAELQSPRYNTYRANNRSKGKDQIWPDHVEEAFQRALRRYPRRGRKKETLNGKQCGGNEFITAYIEKHTGVYRSRKQVSSHLQVLKHFLGDNHEWMSLVKASGLLDDEDSGKRLRGVNCEEATGRWENTIVPASAASQYSQASQFNYLKSLPPSPAKIISSNLSQRPTVRQVDFAMTLEGKNKNVVHTYTSLQSQMASAPKPLEHLKDWRLFYPPLATYHDQGQIDCPVFFFDTNFSLTDDIPENVSLAIELNADVTQSAGFTDWLSHTSFYEDEGRLIDLSKLLRGCTEDPWRAVECSPTRRGDSRLSIPLKSAWWVQFFTHLIRRKLGARDSKDPEAVRKEEDYVNHYLRGFSVMQEIWATSCAFGSQRQKLVILVWKFGKARKEEVATTSWRQLMPPVSPFQVQSPTPPPLQPPLTLDTTIHNAITRHPAALYADYYNPQPSIFSDNAGGLLDGTLSEGSSPATTPPLDYPSFHSSTSTLFPLSISNSGYPLHLLQEAPYQSRDSAFSPGTLLGSFDSQDSQYPPREILHHSQGVYDSQDTIYHSQDALCDQPSNTMYDWPTHQSSIPDDFTGGKTHVSYAQQHEEPNLSAYEPPLIASRANMMPQHQLIQHPEQFDHHDYLEPDLVTSQQEHQHIDWQMVASQPLNVADMRFHPDLEDDIVQQLELLQEHEGTIEGLEGQGQGQVLGEVREGEQTVETGLEEYR